MDKYLNREERRVITTLHELATDNLIVGVASAYSALHDNLEAVARRLCNEDMPEYLDMLAETRQKIDKKLVTKTDDYTNDYTKGLISYRLEKEEDFLRQRGEVACRLLAGIEPSFFNDENSWLNDELRWIIHSLDECPENIDDIRRISRYIPEVKAACEIKQSLNGVNKEAELRYLQVQEHLISCVIKRVPASIIYAYWLELKPKASENLAYYEAVMDNIIGLPCDDWTNGKFIRGVLEFLQELSDSVVRSAIDADVRIMSTSTTSFILERGRTITEKFFGNDKEGSPSNKVSDIIASLRDYSPQSCKHFVIPLHELCDYNANYETIEQAYVATS